MGEANSVSSVDSSQQIRVERNAFSARLAEKAWNTQPLIQEKD
jgi:hypothetical protein